MATLIAIYLIIGTVSFAALVLTWLAFGRLIWVQFQRWTLKGRGYVEVEHVSETGLRNYFVMKPKDYKFDIADGFYHYLPEAITKTGDILKKYDPNFKNVMPTPEELAKLPEDKQKLLLATHNAEKNQLEEFARLISNFKFRQDALTTKWGMPVITYYGTRPDPVLFRDLKTVYGAGVIRDMFMRLLLTQRYKDFQRMMLWLLIIAGLAVVSNIGWYMAYGRQNEMIISQWNAVNTCNNFLIQYLNETGRLAAQNSTIII